MKEWVQHNQLLSSQKVDWQQESDTVMQASTSDFACHTTDKCDTFSQM